MSTPPTERLCILLVEDDSDTREALNELLALEGHDVLAVRTVAAAAKLLADGIRPNVVMLDERLPDGRGSELIRELKALPELGLIPIVLVTAAEIPAVDDASVLVLRKPMDVERLLQSLRGMNGEVAGGDCLAALSGTDPR